jgi:hypothetical protein
MKELLQVFMRRLTNLNSHNRSLLLLRLNSGSHMDLNRFDFLLNKPSFPIIEKLIAGDDEIPVCKILDPRDEQNNQVSRQLKKLRRSGEFIFEERGARDLYVGWPFVGGKFSNGNMVRCPLIFFPVTLLMSEKVWKLSFRKDVGISFNKSFFLAYFYFNNQPADDELLEFNFEEFDRKSRPFRTQLYNLLKDKGIEINFNTELFEDQLLPFREFKKTDFGEREKDGMLKLYPESVVGIFPQAGSFLIPDYSEMLEKNEFKSLEDFFLSKTIEVEDINPVSAGYFEKKIREENIFAPFQLDAWQENALRAVKQGHSLVVQGPPGTGKSQLLCNLIADFISRGKTVLAVSQKRAALDVVFERLKETGIAEFCALVHDFRNDRKEIYQTITDHIEKLGEYKALNGTIDAIQLERNFLKTSRNIDRISEELEELKRALFDESECGLSLKELYLTSSRERPMVDLRMEYRRFNFREIDEFIDKIKKFISLSSRLNRPENLWKQRISFSKFNLADQLSVKDAVQDLTTCLQQIKLQTKDILGTEISFGDAESLSSKINRIEKIISLSKDEETFMIIRKLIKSSPDSGLDSVLTRLNTLLECFNGDGPETSLDADGLIKFQEALQHLMDSGKNPFRWLGWILFNRGKPLVKKVLVVNKLRGNNRDLRVITRKLDNRLNLEHVLTELKKYPWMVDFPRPADYGTYKKLSLKIADAIGMYNLVNEIRELKMVIGRKDYTYQEFVNLLSGINKFLGDFSGKKTGWGKFLSPSQIVALASGSLDPGLLLISLDHDYEYMCEFDRFNEELSEGEKSVIGKLMNASRLHEPEELISLFQNSLRLSWIEHLEIKYPVINTISTGRFDELVKDLQMSVRDKKRTCNEIILLKLREKTYEDIRYNRLNNRETYRELQHQVVKKRNIWPVRKLLTAFPEEIFNLQPCWMASPESASAIFPLIPLFDLVIFDEASQCFSEKGLPSIFKGKQVVIAGDARQLSPFDLYQSRWVQDEEDNTDLEIDSLLDLASRYFMQVQLQGHYRSQSPDLIEFSNRHFYKGNLRMLPDRIRMNRNEPAIRYIKVDGIWENNINSIEADKVIELVDELRLKYPGKSIGIITFNAPQQELISERIEMRFEKKNEIEGYKIFIKNIENVQGDERDIIIFSLVHAPDEKGMMSRQFGSLNIKGGENRLNVAITRAREMIYVVASFRPEAMEIKGLKNEGPVLLKKYLQFAAEVSEGNFRPDNFRHDLKNRPWYLRDRLAAELNQEFKENISVGTDMPFADLTVKNRDGYLGLILSDDDLYYQSLSVKDIHAYTPFLYSAKNWKFKAVFSREYWKNKNETLEQISRFIYQSVASEVEKK